MKDEEIRNLNIQLVALIVYIISLMISYLITENEKRNILKAKKIFKNEIVKYVSIFNRILVLLLTLAFLYVTISDRKRAIKNHENLNLFNLQLLASLLSLAATIIVLYVVIVSSGEEYSIISGSENPSL